MLKKKKKLEAAIGYVLKEKVFLEILQNSQEEICTRKKKETLVQVLEPLF